MANFKFSAANLSREIVKFVLILNLISCGPRISYRLIQDQASIPLSVTPTQSMSACNDALSYVPDTLFEEANHTYTINLNYHAVDHIQGKNNFSLEEMSPYFWLLTENANLRLGLNEQMKLPLGNNTPKLKPYYKYKMSASLEFGNTTALYHHKLEDKNIAFFLNKGSGQNNYDRSINTLTVNSDSILNVFVMSYPPDVLAKDPGKYHGAGISLGTTVKIAGLYQKGGEHWAYATLLNHEIGHAFGLSHAWIADGCDDTPTNPNCFDDQSCVSIASNNMMDYNNSQMALTPCQIGRVRMFMAKEEGYHRKLLEIDWCKSLEEKTIYIEGDHAWLGARDIATNIEILPGASLRLCCRVSMAEGTEIFVRAGGKLILDGVKLHNSCGYVWDGIVVEKKGKKVGEVETIGKVEIMNCAPVQLAEY